MQYFILSLPLYLLIPITLLWVRADLTPRKLHAQYAHHFSRLFMFKYLQIFPLTQIFKHLIYRALMHIPHTMNVYTHTTKIPYISQGKTDLDKTAKTIKINTQKQVNICTYNMQIRIHLTHCSYTTYMNRWYIALLCSISISIWYIRSK